jgi:hypothetical protein
VFELLETNITIQVVLLSVVSEMELQDKVLYTKLSTWLCYGNYLLYLLLKTMDMRWELLLKEQRTMKKYGN